MTSKSPFGDDTQRYWDRRYELFSKFDYGIVIDREGLFSVKPEQIAQQIGEDLSGSIVLDCFCGVGGSAIGFALSGKKVISVDIDDNRIAAAKKNAKIYGVFDSIEFIKADVIGLINDESLSFDSIYFDPPWGGPEYYKEQLFSFAMFDPNVKESVNWALNKGVNIALTVPNNFDFNEVRDLFPDFKVQKNMLADRCLFRTIYSISEV